MPSQFKEQKRGLTDEELDQIRQRKIKDLEVKAAKEREKLEIVCTIL